MNHRFFFPFLTVIILLNAAVGYSENDPMIINSGKAEFNGKEISLSGHVVVEHDLGSLEANQMTLVPEKMNEKIQAKHLSLKEDVNIALKNAGKLSCHLAEIDFSNLTGKFYGGANQEFVAYTEFFADKNGESVPLVVKSREMIMQIAQENDEPNHSTKTSVSNINAEKEVTVNYNNDFMASADQASYQRVKCCDDQDQKNKHLAGLITLRANEEHGVCQITNRNGDMITSDNLCIDTNQRQLFFAYPKGALYTAQNKDVRNRIDFSSDTMTWEDKVNSLTLRENVVIHQNGLGTLVSDKDVKINQETVDGKKQLNTILSSGKTVIRYMEQDKEIAHILTCHGQVCVDNKQLKTTMDSPSAMSGKILRENQVSFQDPMGDIFADKLIIDYINTDNNLKPVKITLEGNVHILNRCSVDAENKSDFIQYAIADSVEYTPQAKEITLKANPNSRVLFLDKVNNLQVSAPALKIRRDETTKKESIQGIGNVRFTFVKKEIEMMSSEFHLDPTQK